MARTTYAARRRRDAMLNNVLVGVCAVVLAAVLLGICAALYTATVAAYEAKPAQRAALTTSCR